MDVPAEAAGPWIALGAVLGMLLILAVGATVLRLRGPSRPEAPARPVEEPRDDLADFLAHPPGTRGEPARSDRDGWVPLTAPPRPVERDDPAPPPPGTRPGPVLAGLAVLALLLVGAAAALAAVQRSPADPPPADASSASTGPSGGQEGVAARLAFDGVVLEEHAVGITAARPELELTSDADGRAVARLRLPAVNCLATDVPPEAGDPACRAARTEYAELTGPDLRVDRDGDRLEVSGRFATSWHSPGAPPEMTGRSYQLSVTVEATGDGDDGWRPVEGVLHWDGQDAATRTDGAPSVVRAGS